MKQIIVIGDNSSTNLGDPILTQSAYHIICKIVENKDYNISIFDIANRSNKKKEFFNKGQIKSIRNISKFKYIIKKIILDIKTFVKWFCKEESKFNKRLENTICSKNTVFVIAGGALISSSLFYALRINAIVKAAKRHNGKVIFNAVGIEKTIRNIGFAKYIVRHYLKQPQIIAFSTRDHVEDVPYISNRKEFQILQPDPGLFAADAFQVRKKESDIIGLSVISYEAYQSVMLNDKRANKITPEDLLSFWGKIIRDFISNGKNFKILTNGGSLDYQIALRICKMMNLDTEKYLLPLATEPKVLIEQLSQFKLVIAHRLHALIVSSSLGIPVIPIVWSDKVVSFSKMIGNPHAQWPSQNININDLLNIEIDKKIIIQLKQQIIDYLSKYLI